MSEKENFLQAAIQGSRADSLYEKKTISKETRAFTYDITTIELFLEYCAKNKIKASAIINGLLTNFVQKNIPNPFEPDNLNSHPNVKDEKTQRYAYSLFYKREFIASVNRLFATRARDYKNRRKSINISRKMAANDKFDQAIQYSYYLLQKLQTTASESALKEIQPYVRDLKTAADVLKKRQNA